MINDLIKKIESLRKSLSSDRSRTGLKGRAFPNRLGYLGKEASGKVVSPFLVTARIFVG